jgi:hypothetical protein
MHLVESINIRSKKFSLSEPSETRAPREGTNRTNGAIGLSFGTRKKMLPEMNEITVIAASAKEIHL